MKPPLEACPERFDLGGGVRWWLVDPAWQGTARAAAADVADPSAIAPHRLLKSGRRRLVFLQEAAAGCIIVKAFPLHELRSRLKHRKYAFSEAHNLWQARRRGVPAPALYGWGSERHLGMVRWNAVLMQHVAGASFVEALARAPDEAARLEYMRRVAVLFRAMFQAGCNHIDLKPEAVRLGENESEDAVIDFQYCSFGNAPRLDTVMAQAGHFAHWWEKVAPPRRGELGGFVSVLLDALEVPQSQRTATVERFEHNRRHVESIAVRLRQ